MNKIDAMVCEQVLNELLLPQCKDVVKFECSVVPSGNDFKIKVNVLSKHYYILDRQEDYDLLTLHLKMIGITFWDYIFSIKVIK